MTRFSLIGPAKRDYGNPEAVIDWVGQQGGACKLVVYCSRECQAKHWKSHKDACAQFRRAKAPVPVFPS